MAGMADDFEALVEILANPSGQEKQARVLVPLLRRVPDRFGLDTVHHLTFQNMHHLRQVLIHEDSDAIHEIRWFCERYSHLQEDQKVRWAGKPIGPETRRFMMVVEPHDISVFDVFDR